MMAPRPVLALLEWWRALPQRLRLRIVGALPRSLCYWAGVRMLSEYVGRDLSRCSKITRATAAGNVRMVHVCEQFINRGRAR